MLIACPSCHRQYDVGAHPAGAKVRCFCGVTVVVPKPERRDAKMLHCSGCGAGLPAGTTDCGFCGSSVGLGQKGLGDACPSCYSRLLKGAKFCSTCGTEIRPAAVLKALSDHSCPRCEQPMSECTAPNANFVECTKCGGLWLGESTFRALTERREQNAAPALLAARTPPPAAARDPSEDLTKVVYLPCPVCRQRMNRRNFARSSGVILDWCRGHGFWFDADELERILAFIQRGGLEQQREREKEQLESERRRAEAARRDARTIPATRRFETRTTGAIDVVDALSRLITRWLT